MERNYIHEGFGGESAELNKEMKKIYTDKKSEINEYLSGSQQAFKDERYSDAKKYCNKTIKACDELEKEIGKLNTTKLNGIGRIARSRYLRYATYMRDDAKLAIKQAEESIKEKNKN